MVSYFRPSVPLIFLTIPSWVAMLSVVTFMTPRRLLAMRMKFLPPFS
jgi:hypothetical protein